MNKNVNTKSRISVHESGVINRGRTKSYFKIERGTKQVDSILA